MNGGINVNNSSTGSQYAAVVTRVQVVLEARKWVGTRWQHQASLIGVGSDCIGMIAGVARVFWPDLGAEFEADSEIRGYGREPNQKMLIAACSRYLVPIDVRTARMGDILLMRYTEPRHFALLSRRAPDYIIHCYAQMRKVVEHGMDDAWRNRIVSAWAFRGINE